MAQEMILEARNLAKSFGGVQALRDASISIRAGEVVAVVGDNGAGKSTFIKTLSGVHEPDSGVLEVLGEPQHFTSPQQARAMGIETVYQDLSLCDDLNVVENMFLGRETSRLSLGWLSVPDRRGMRKRAKEMLAETGVNIPDLRQPVRAMSGGQRQCLAIAKGSSWDSRLIILDEPTAALGVRETAAVEDIIRDLRRRGMAVIIISHNLRQVFDLVDTIWVLRRGEMVGSRAAAATTAEEIIAMITGVDNQIVV
ncbi:ATP-binding cassette domain-containing protein [Rhodococcus ruber]|uniref:ATP-binding cassette domain-containing protein n=1 Tax=Rhodococcus ruber TaxID=1830 RepID=A0ABT4MEE8_9NOCA|nr:ATP-binding cassette domain-containing protein [Rhodococcus ruber]MCZ4519342.1 ATP-binding cassette domain-containing protein [Rhodococcus ruber]